MVGLRMWKVFFAGGVVLMAAVAARGGEPAAQELPPALRALGIGADQVLSAEEAATVRGQALDYAELLAKAADVFQRAQIAEYPGGVYYFHGAYFGDGLLINQQTGRGTMFRPENPAAGTLFFSNLQGNFSVQRDANGMLLFNGALPP